VVDSLVAKLLRRWNIECWSRETKSGGIGIFQAYLVKNEFLGEIVEWVASIHS
jgi:hypothetical protein